MAGYSSAVTADSPLFYWRLGETSGTTAADTSGNNRPGTYAGGFTLNQTSALMANSTDPAVLLDGTNGKVTRSSYTPWSGTVTMEAWVKLTSAPSSWSANGALFSRTSATGGQGLLFGGGANADQLIFFASGTSGVVWSFPFKSGHFYHIVAIYDPTSTSNCKCYIDATDQSSTITGSAVAYGAQTGISIGLAGTSTAPLPATVDEVAMYSGALNAVRVTVHYEYARTHYFYDTATPSDAVRKAPTVRPSDSVSLAQALRNAITLRKSDTATPTETVRKQPTLGRSDSVSTSEALHKGFTLRPADSLSLSEAIRKAFSFHRSDSLAITEAVRKALAFRRSDNLSLAETVRKAVALLRGDNVSLSSSTSNRPTLHPSDAVALADQKSAHAVVALDDTLALAESVAHQWAGSLHLQDSLTLVEAVAKAVDIEVADAAPLTDALRKQKRHVVLRTPVRSELRASGDVRSELRASGDVRSELRP